MADKDTRLSLTAAPVKLVDNKDGTHSVAVSITGSLANITGDLATVTTAGTRVQLPNIACREITIIAKRANTGFIFVGGSDVASIKYGAELAAKDSITLAIANANQVYIDSTVNGEGISYVCL